MSKNLYDITDDYMSVIAEIEDNEGVITEELESKLQIAEEELEDKLRAYCSIIKKQEAFKTYNKDEIKRLRDRNQVFDNNKERLCKYVIPALHMFGNRTAAGNYNLKFADFSVSTRVNDTVSVSTEKVQGLLDMATGITETTVQGWSVINNCVNELDSLGGVEVSLVIPFSDVKKYRDQLQSEASSSAVWNVSKKAVKELMKERIALYDLINSDGGNEDEIERYDRLTQLLNYIQADIIETETVTFK